MNKFSIMAKSAIITVAMIGIACADNNSSLTNWAGLYAGVDAGFVFNKTQLKSHQLGFTNPNETCNSSSDFSSFFPGIQVGYMHPFPNNVVAGIEVNATFNTRQKDRSSCNSRYNSNVSDRFSFRNKMQSSIKGRAGRALNWNQSILLPYLTGGVSFANVGLAYNNEEGDYYDKKNNQQTGALIGAGLEWAFRPNWSLRAEYSYVNYGNIIKLRIPSVYGLIDLNGGARVNLNTNSIVVALNYWV